MARKQYPAWQARHFTVLKWLYENNWGPQYRCARETGYSVSQVSRIVNSPDFKLQAQRLLDQEFKEIVISSRQYKHKH